MRRMIVYIAVVALVPLLAACGALPFGNTGPDSCDSANALFEDDFSGEQTCGWLEYNRGGAVAAISDGSLIISTSSPGKYKSGQDRVTYLTEDGQFAKSEQINQGVAVNQIQASCVGNELALSVNGYPLLTVIDSDFVAGDIGLALSALQQGTVEVEFDDLRVTAP
jgi:hypothetical protein